MRTPPKEKSRLQAVFLPSRGLPSRADRGKEKEKRQAVKLAAVLLKFACFNGVCERKAINAENKIFLIFRVQAFRKTRRIKNIFGVAFVLVCL